MMMKDDEIEVKERLSRNTTDNATYCTKNTENMTKMLGILHLE